MNTSYAQIIDDFSQNDMINNLLWSGDLEDFSIINERLHLDASEAGISFLKAGYFFDEDMEISIWIDMDLAPSQNNRFELRLFQLTDSLNAEEYISLEIGESESEDAMEIRHYFLQGDSLLGRGEDASFAQGGEHRIRIYYQNGYWELQRAEAGSPYFHPEDSFYHPMLSDSSQFFMIFEYTSSNTNAFLVDDVYVGPRRIDSLPPELIQAELISDHEIRLSFDEALDSSSLNSSNYLLLPALLEADSASFFDAGQRELYLRFEEEFEAWIGMQLEMNAVMDLQGNSIDHSFDLVYEPRYYAAFKELQFTEIMADPSPPVGLPNAEYIEIYNASDSILDLEGYYLMNSEHRLQLPNTLLGPGTFLLLCDHSDSILFDPELYVLGMEWVALVNSGDSLGLFNFKDELLDRVVYNDSWYGDALKKEGGWSLEKISTDVLCSGEVNWKASEALQGGSPGQPNSLDEVFPENYLDHFYFDEEGIRLKMKYELHADQGLLSIASSPPWLADSIVIENNLCFLYRSGSDSIHYRIFIQGLKSCWNEASEEIILDLALPGKADAGDIVFNEILFDPLTGGVDFVEIKNQRDHFIDLRHWRVEEYEGGQLIEDAMIPFEQLLIGPGQVLALCRDPELLRQYYPGLMVSRVISLSDLPNLPDGGAHLRLRDASFELMDSATLDASMHFPLLSETEGVSLFRNADQWISHPAPEYASPGYELKKDELGHSGDFVEFGPQFISPNGDGIDDRCNFVFKSEEAAIIRGTLFDKEGRFMQLLFEDEHLLGELELSWDGLVANEYLPGVYFILLEAFMEDGSMRQHKDIVFVN